MPLKVDLRRDWGDIFVYFLLFLIVASSGGLVWIAVANEIAKGSGEEITVAVAPISWDHQDADPGNWGLYALNPAYLPLAMGSPEECWVEFELEGRVWEEEVSNELCTTRSDAIQITYLDYAYGIDILEVSE